MLPPAGAPHARVTPTLLMLGVVLALLLVPSPSRATPTTQLPAGASTPVVAAGTESVSVGLRTSTLQPVLASRAGSVIRLVNRARSRSRWCGDEHFAARRPLRPSLRLTLAAQRYAAQLASRWTFSHVGPNGSGPDDRIRATGYRSTSWGENLAAGQPTPAAVVAAWLASPGHCANIMGRFTQIGVGFVHRPGSRYGTYWVQDLGSPR